MSYDYSEMVKYMLHWYDYNARVLPWRDQPTPYYVWISEVMLQQTRVEAVIPYFERFISNLPNIEALAYVEEEELLKLWEGLGYYSRVRNLQKAAKMILKEYHGELPTTIEPLLTLPGIGPYTAGAIASIAYQIPVPAIDGNVYRVMKRIAGSFDDITKSRVKKELEEDLLRTIPKDRPGDFNQSIMDLGATICIPNGKPYCDKCPVVHLCKAFRDGTMELIPVKPTKKSRVIEEKTILVMEYKNRVGIIQREKKGLLGGLWSFPSIDRHLEIDGVEEYIAENNILGEVESLGQAKHIFTHIEWHMIGYYIRIKECLIEEDMVWATKEELESRYTLPTAYKKYRAMVNISNKL